MTLEGSICSLLPISGYQEVLSDFTIDYQHSKFCMNMFKTENQKLKVKHKC